MTLPVHCATDDEPIPALDTDRYNGPDMRRAQSIADMLIDLRKVSDDEHEYVERWREMLKSVGGSASVNIDKEGVRHLTIGTPCDFQMRHRSRWIHYLVRDLDGMEGRRDHLKRRLISEGHYSDNRPVDPRRTTRAVRGFLQIQGRILLDPQGRLMEGGGLPQGMQSEDYETSSEAMRAAFFYLETLRRFRSDRQIRRTVEMLGRRTENGWIVLETRA